MPGVGWVSPISPVNPRQSKRKWPYYHGSLSRLVPIRLVIVRIARFALMDRIIGVSNMIYTWFSTCDRYPMDRYHKSIHGRSVLADSYRYWSIRCMKSLFFFFAPCFPLEKEQLYSVNCEIFVFLTRSHSSHNLYIYCGGQLELARPSSSHLCTPCICMDLCAVVLQ